MGCVRKHSYVHYVFSFYHIDIDECKDGTHLCSRNCRNTQGKYECYCKDGYVRGEDNTSCNGIFALCSTRYVLVFFCSMSSQIDIHFHYLFVLEYKSRFIKMYRSKYMFFTIWQKIYGHLFSCDTSGFHLFKTYSIQALSLKKIFSSSIYRLDL